jgi:Skp family chaperone for outer membrane proteins
MKTLKTLHVAALLVCAGLPASSFGAADLKFGTIDLQKVFSKYYKTELANAAIQDEVAGLQKDNKALIEEHTKAVDDYKKALDEANNQAVSAEEREKRKKEAEGRLIKINDLRQTIDQFERTAKGNIEEKLRQSREKIIKEIREVITSKSRSAGMTMVFDSSTSELGRLPVVLYTNGTNDLTDEILAQLNANAPPDLPKPDEQKGEEKKNDKK